jgi:hypothetical protein
MTNQNIINILAISLASILLAGCAGEAETTVIERKLVDETPITPGNGDASNPNDFLIDSMGRLAVMSFESDTMSLIDIDDGSLLDNFPMQYAGIRVSASADSRYAVLSARNFDSVEFLDGGLWREDHIDHPHDNQQAPSMSDFVLSGSRPNHISAYGGKLAVFYDGDSESGIPASVQVVSDNDITSETSSPASLMFAVNMHGVAKPRGEFVLASIRRDDVESTSHIKVLPDQVGIYHEHDSELELEQVLDVTCSDMHGSAQNSEFVVFGCGDGVLIAHEHDGMFEAHKIDSIALIDGVRIGTLYGHEDSEAFVGIASSRATGVTTLLTINPAENEMEVLDWQAVDGAKPVSYSFTYDGEHLVILDNQGYITLLAVEQQDGHTHLAFEGRLDITELDVAMMPEGASFALTASKNDNHIYVADPMAKHILQIDIVTLSIKGDIEVNFVPASMVWLGIAAEDHDHL